MANLKILTKAQKVGILTQTAWATPQLASANYKTIQWINAGIPIPDPNVQIDQFNVTSQNGIHAELERRFLDGASGLSTIPFSGTCDKSTMALFYH